MELLTSSSQKRPGVVNILVQVLKKGGVALLTLLQIKQVPSLLESFDVSDRDIEWTVQFLA